MECLIHCMCLHTVCYAQLSCACFQLSGVKKKVEAAGKRKGCAILCDWSQSISNHLYFCAASSGGDGELLEQKWCSLLNHVVDIHEGHGSRYPKCQHGQLDDRAWIKKGEESFIFRPLYML